MIWVVALLLFANFLLRLGFALYNGLHLQAVSFADLALAFGVGVRFDLATIMIFTGLVFLILLLPIPALHRESAYKRFNIFILMLNLPVFLVNAVDIVYYGFAEKRLTHELYSIKFGDVTTTAGAGFFDFWWLLFLVGSLTYGLSRLMWWATQRVLESPAEPRKYGKIPVWLAPLVGGGLIFLCIRGGFQQLPLRPSMAFVSASNFAGNLGLNSAYTVVSSLMLEKDTRLDLLPDEQANETIRRMVVNDFDQEWAGPAYPLLRRADFPGPEKRYNVVMIIVESLDALHVGSIVPNDTAPSLTPFIDSLAKTGLLFTRFHANSNRSIEALPAILNSLPDIYGRPLIGSAHENINHWGIGNILHARGYNTSFYHGGRNGTMGFDNYSRISGLEDYFGLDEYPESERDYDGNWGIFDSPFFAWWGDQLNQTPEPFLSVLFTISNHHPFTLPENGYEDIKHLRATPYQKTIAYTDRVLEEFFTRIDTMPWKDSTLFVITADHCFFEPTHPTQNSISHSHIPLLLIGPGIEPGVSRKISNQINIMPTLIEALRLDTWHSSGGVSLLSDKPAFAITNNMGIVTLMHDSLTWSTDFVRPRTWFYEKDGAWKAVGDPMQMPEAQRKEMDLEARAGFQTFLNIRANNAVIGSEYMK